MAIDEHSRYAYVELLPDEQGSTREGFEECAPCHLAELGIRIGGKATLLGIPPAGTKIELDPFEFTTREKTLTGTIAGSGPRSSVMFRHMPRG